MSALPFLLALVALLVIIYTTLFVESLLKKLLIFLTIGGVTALSLGLVAGDSELANKVLHHIFLVDYAQFIMIPLATVFIASLALFNVKTKPGAKVGWFLFLFFPIAGNLATTWAVVPLGLSLVEKLKKDYPERWLHILIASCVFSMNMLALATLAADPPQALWAVKAALSGKALGYLFPLTKFWPYLLVTWGLYYVVLKRLGVEFGVNPLTELNKFRPESWSKFAYGLFMAVCIGVAVTLLKGYQITMFLGGICALTGIVAMMGAFSHKQKHDTIHWLGETSAIFVAFFSVVSFLDVGFHYVHVSHELMVPLIVVETLFADNAAAFATGYNHFQPLDQFYMTWYNLFPSVSFGGMSPLGNGPQIVLFLVILPSMGLLKTGQVFITWFREALVFVPYLMVWLLSAMITALVGIELSVPLQLLIGVVAFVVGNQFMDIQSTFRANVNTGKSWDGRTQDYNREMVTTELPDGASA